MAIWTDDASGGGWTVRLPADYLTDPQVGVPIAPAGYDALGRLAATIVTAPPVGAAPAAGDTTAAVLVPSPPTGANPHPTPPARIAVSAVPNPFNSSVRIGYTLPREAPTRVTIHDAAGRVVATFDRGVAPAGSELGVTWDGTNQAGARAASGVYFVRVVTDYATAARKIVLTK
jgi:hypothetical protein